MRACPMKKDHIPKDTPANLHSGSRHTEQGRRIRGSWVTMQAGSRPPIYTNQVQVQGRWEGVGKGRGVVTIPEIPEEGLMDTRLGPLHLGHSLGQERARSCPSKTNTVASRHCGGEGGINHFLPHTVYCHTGSLSTKSKGKSTVIITMIYLLFPLYLAPSSRHRPFSWQCGSRVRIAEQAALQHVEGAGGRTRTEMLLQYP